MRTSSRSEHGACAPASSPVTADPRRGVTEEIGGVDPGARGTGRHDRLTAHPRPGRGSAHAGRRVDPDQTRGGRMTTYTNETASSTTTGTGTAGTAKDEALNVAGT